LRGDTAEIDRGQGVGDEVADLRLGIMVLGVVQADLRRIVLDRVDHFAETQQLDLARAAVDLGADVIFQAVFRAAGLLNGLLHGLQNLVAVDTLVTGNGVGDLQQFRAGEKR